ncbi:hypothetical protein K3U93_04940 [Mycobacterium malmoense]|uniref:PE-PGRS family protein n=1 Tax=Mycobacterium malmoense TaxID=1780 RepID=A0ABX3SYR8_MYCMA|nr:hypothetical protein [Mycobacterium malmoense]ORA85224.1 hypothetical protein BST29_03320 [Mycobacterium malmoense]QZA18543.1 hypothetical protein K3U93_04940 [Mycobacterium malmoense]
MVVDLAARPHITAGVALASAAVIATGPMAQHLPQIDAARYLPQVSVTDINLTDAASALDLFGGVESQLASLAGGASAAAVPAAAVSNAVNPLQTWIDIVPKSTANIENIVQNWLAHPAPILQQVLANFAQYGVDYVTPFKTAANAAVTYFTGPGAGNFAGQLMRASMAYSQGQVATAVNDVVGAVFTSPIVKIGFPLEKTLVIPGLMLQNLTDATNFLTTTAIGTLGNTLSNLPVVTFNGLAGSLQAVSDAQASGDSIGAVTNFLDIPGQMVDAFLNGHTVTPGKTLFNNGLLNSVVGQLNGGTIQDIVNSLPQQLAKAIVAPNAQNVVSGGSLAAAFQNLETVATQGWPSLTPIMNTLTSNLSNIGSQLTALLQNLPSGLSNLPSMLSTIAAGVGTFILSLLKML